MKKALSLKKNQQGAPRNQASITQFFKFGTETQKSKKSPEYVTAECLKRKASSELINEACNNTNSPKKSKIEGTKHSPNKENGCQLPTSSEKSSNISLSPAKSPQKSSNKEKNNCINQSPRIKSSRLPLSPLKIEEKSDNTKNHVDHGQSHVKSLFTEKVEAPVNKLQENNVTNTIDDQVQKKERNWTPKKSPFKAKAKYIVDLSLKLFSEYICSPTKDADVLASPSKSGSTVKTLDVADEDVGDMFGDEWDVDDIQEENIEDLDLSTMQRCEILSVVNHGCKLELKLKNAKNNRATCFVEGIWLDTPLIPRDIISVLASKDTSNRFCVTNTSGLIVLRPDHLVSSTSVVAGVFCKRKAILQERWKGIDSANTAMTIGIIIHELVQKALTQNISSLARLRLESDLIIKESVQRLYDAGLSEEEARSNIQTYVPPLAEFMQKYVEKSGTQQVQNDKNNWKGHIDKVLDIEENLCCPQLGLKGKIDATLQVTIHERQGKQKAVVPLELKSGKASVSAEHRGQLVLYGMMLALMRSEDPTSSTQRGLLLYLRDRVDIREVSCGYPERRDLIMLRNQLVQYLAHGPEDVDPEKLVDIEDASILLQQRLPEPVSHPTACAKCPYLTLCSLHLWHTDGPIVSECHALSKLQPSALGHLAPGHIQYFLHWTSLLHMEERGQMVTSPLHSLWTDDVDKRSKRGSCASKLKLKSVKQSVDRHLHIFEREHVPNTVDTKKPPIGPQEGEYSIVSIDNRPWIAAGVVILSNHKEIHIVLERDLSRRLNKATLYQIDTYESYATTVQNLTNLGVLMEDSERAERLRKVIIDKTKPEFDTKLPREVGRLGSKLMRSLNIEQQRAVLKAISAKEYVLLRGLPGTGKTQTISVLIQMLVGLKQRVLVTAHTHSAVDTVLTRLPDTVKIMRLGSTARVAPSLIDKCEQSLVANCDTPEQLERVYGSVEVVGVTCLGSAHAMLARTTFDVCIVDEATQVLQCTVLRPLFAAKRFVLVGDPDQLPPVVRSRAARRLGMEESLFHRLMCEDVTSTLQLQYRMNQAIVDVANKVAYNDKLKCADENVASATLDVDVKKLESLDASWLQKSVSPLPKDAVLFVDMKCVGKTINMTDNKSCTNEEEAIVVMDLIGALKQVGIKSKDIGVIAPYRDQVSLLRRCLLQHSVDVSTVDQFQGRDKSVIIYSCTRRDEDERKVKEGEVLNDQRRLAVSVTRAKHKLILIGYSLALQRYAPLQRLINACSIINLEQDIIKKLRIKYKTAIS